MSTRDGLLRLLNDREFVSGAALGRELGVSRAAVQKHIQALEQSGLPVHRVPGRGYRLARGVHLLDGVVIERHLSAHTRRLLHRIHVPLQVDSTSDFLRRLSAGGSVHGHACLTEVQASGRGRRGNEWIASPYRNLMLSLSWRYESWPEAVTTLGLAVAAAIAGAVDPFADDRIQIKWPNDLVCDGRKLGGIVMDVQGEGAGPCDVIVGVGVNVLIDELDAPRIDQAWTDLAAVSARPVDRNVLAAACIDALASALQRFERDGFDAWREQWERRHVLTGRRAVVRGAAGAVSGTVIGIDASGALLLRDGSGVVRRCFHGEVSVRTAE